MKITGITTMIVEVPLSRPIRWATGGLSEVGECYVEIATDEGVSGLGFAYPQVESRAIIDHRFAPLLIGRDPFDTEALWEVMHDAVHTIGQDAIALNAISAVDIGLWDLKGRALGLPLYRLLGAHSTSLPVYGSGGFVSYSLDELLEEMMGFVERGIGAVKMKIGIERGGNDRLDVQRVAAVREAIGDDTVLFVDANGAYTAKQAISVARRLEELRVGWYEEPVHASDQAGLAAVARATTIPVATGEFEYTLAGFRSLLELRGADIVQADAGRVGGVTGWCKIAHLAEAFNVPLAPHAFDLLHLHLGCSTPNTRILEHLAIYDELPYSGTPDVVGGLLTIPPDAIGHGITLDPDVVEKYRA